MDALRKRILVVDDEEHIVELLAMTLRQNGFDHLVARSGPEAVDVALRELPDLILLDLMLPGMSGLEVCRAIRQDPRAAAIPVIMLTAKSEESDKVIGLGIGADDYVTKPFGLRELIARVEAALRRSAAPSRGGIATEAALADKPRSGDIVVDLAAHEVLRRGERLQLSPTEFELLLHLVRNTGKAMRRSELIRAIGLQDGDEEGRSLDVHVRNLRRKLGSDSGGGDYIETVRGLGYRLHA